jgi:hypothetical protein
VVVQTRNRFEPLPAARAQLEGRELALLDSVLVHAPLTSGNLLLASGTSANSDK